LGELLPEKATTVDGAAAEFVD